MQKDKQPQDEKVIQKLNARAQTFAANTLGNAGQKRTEQVIQWFNGMRITTKELVHTDAIIEDQLTVNLLGELTRAGFFIICINDYLGLKEQLQ